MTALLQRGNFVLGTYWLIDKSWSMSIFYENKGVKQSNKDSSMCLCKGNTNHKGNENLRMILFEKKKWIDR